MNKNITNRAYIKVANEKDIHILNKILQESFPDSFIDWNKNICKLCVADNESFQLKLIKIYSMEIQEFGIEASFLIVPFFDSLFLKYLGKLKNSVSTAFEVFLKNITLESTKKDCKNILNMIDARNLDTIKAFLRCNGNLSLTAKELYLHRNSLNYRMAHFIKETTMDIRDLNTIMFLKLLTGEIF